MIEFVSYLVKILAQSENGDRMPLLGITTKQFFYVAIAVAAFLIVVMILIVATKTVGSILSVIPLTGLIVIAIAVLIAFFVDIAKIVNTILLIAAIIIGIVGLLTWYKIKKREAGITRDVENVKRGAENIKKDAITKKTEVDMAGKRIEEISDQLETTEKAIEDAAEKEKKR